MVTDLFWQRAWDEFLLLLNAPFLVPDMWWIITPLIAITVIMTFYFGKYVTERLGWNTALSNSTVLVFVGLDLLRTIYHYSTPASIWNFAWYPVTVLVIALIVIEGVGLSVTAWKHAIPPKIMFFIASPIPVNVQAYVITAMTYLQITPTFYTLVAALALFFIIYFILRCIQEIEHFAFGKHPKGEKWS